RCTEETRAVSVPDPSSLNADDHLVRAGYRIQDLFERDDLGPAEAVDAARAARRRARHARPADRYPGSSQLLSDPAVRPSARALAKALWGVSNTGRAAPLRRYAFPSDRRSLTSGLQTAWSDGGATVTGQ